jgi:hypothetical protein
MLLTKLVTFIRKTHEHKEGVSFPWKEEALEQYLAWAFSRDYLFVAQQDGEPTGVSVIYPIPKPFDGDFLQMMPFDDEVPKSDEHTKDLVIMDSIFSNAAARIGVTSQFMERYPNWKEQRKFATRKKVVSLLNNRYFELTKGLTT